MLYVRLSCTATVLLAWAISCSDSSGQGSGIALADLVEDHDPYVYSEIAVQDDADDASKEETTPADVASEVAMIPSCIGSELQPAYAAYDEECQDITEPCVYMERPEGEEGCFCFICGFFGPNKKCFFVCCHEDCTR